MESGALSGTIRVREGPCRRGEHLAEGEGGRVLGARVPHRGEDGAAGSVLQVDQSARRVAARPDEIGHERDGVARLDQADLRLQVGGLDSARRVRNRRGGTAARPSAATPRRAAPSPRRGRAHPRCESTACSCRGLGGAARRMASVVSWWRSRSGPRCGVGRVLLGDDHVEVARPGLVERGLGLALRHLDPHLRMLRAHEVERVRHERQRRRLEHGHAHGAASATSATRRAGASARSRMSSSSRRVLHEDLGLRRELHAPARPCAAARRPSPSRAATSCCDTDEGLKFSAAATSARVPRMLEFAQQAQASDIEHPALFILRKY